jgi:hypothetical protein
MGANITTVRPPSERQWVRDREFVRRVRRLRELREFVADNPPLENAGAVLTALYSDNIVTNVHYVPIVGRTVSIDELSTVNCAYLRAINSYDPKQRADFSVWRVRGFFSSAPTIFLALAVISLLIGFIYTSSFRYQPDAPISDRLPGFISIVLWTLSLGGMGACAFLSTAFLSSRQRGERQWTFDDLPISFGDKIYLKTRLVVGMLFAFIIGVPSAYDSIYNVLSTFGTAGEQGGEVSFDYTEMFKLLLPFLVGFSINIVFALLTRLLDALRAFFGITQTSPRMREPGGRDLPHDQQPTVIAP